MNMVKVYDSRLSVTALEDEACIVEGPTLPKGSQPDNQKHSRSLKDRPMLRLWVYKSSYNENEKKGDNPHD